MNYYVSILKTKNIKYWKLSFETKCNETKLVLEIVLSLIIKLLRNLPISWWDHYEMFISFNIKNQQYC